MDIDSPVYRLGAPRVSGDEPITTGLGDINLTCSPRKRG